MGVYSGPANAWSNFTNQNRIDASTKVIIQNGKSYASVTHHL